MHLYRIGKKNVFFFVLAAFLIGTGYAFSVEEPFRELSEQYGIEFKYRIDDDFFPSYWRRPPVDVHAEPVTDKEIERFPRLIAMAFSKYPAQLLKDNLRAVYITRTLYCYGVRYGATYSNGTIYLTSDGPDRGYSDNYLISTFHHEFSSILLNNYSFPGAQWVASNPRGVRYRYPGEGGYRALVEGTGSLDGSEPLYREGFVNDYAASHMEEDFSEFSACVFSNPLMMKELMHTYPVMKNKFEVWIEFFSKLDRSFTREKILMK